ncbi:MAG: ATP-binding protein [Verrucomicrobia bacterium]|nr:ATP-binding protein [Verrucomicrobiota bacterium]MCH8510774.1 AAA family ATPase [Kiritimatiellia bacterium]
MPTADQIKSLIHSHFTEDQERFYTIALQMAAHEARQGHSSLAMDIRRIVDEERKKSGPKLLSFPKELQGLVLTEEPMTGIQSLVIPTEIQNRLKRVVHEYRQQEKLKSHGLSHRRKLLLMGPPGTGKTMTARVLAHELGLSLHTIQVDRLVTKFMGETAAKLRQIFDLIRQEHGVYLFDEFDAIGGDRSTDNDVGEMRRVLNAFLQFIDQDTSDSLIVAATNTPRLLDPALFRRFDDVITYDHPSSGERKTLIRNLLTRFMAKNFAWNQVLAVSEGLSHAEIDHACRDAVKNAILSDKTKISASDLLVTLRERKSTTTAQKG